MIDLTLSHEQSGGTLLGSNKENNGPKYPPGMSLTLDTQMLQKLAIDMPQVGDTFALEGLVTVMAVSKQDGQVEDGTSVTLQITALGLEPPEEQRTEQQVAYDKLKGMYGGPAG